MLLTSEENMSEENLQDFSTNEILKMQQDKIKSILLIVYLYLGQDDMLDECYGLLINTKRSNREIENEIKNQAPMLKDLEKQMDTVEERMKRAKEKLNQYVEKSSNSCLLTTMCLMIVLMLILILS